MGEVCCWDGKDQHRLVKAEGECVRGMQLLTVCGVLLCHRRSGSTGDPCASPLP